MVDLARKTASISTGGELPAGVYNPNTQEFSITSLLTPSATITTARVTSLVATAATSLQIRQSTSDGSDNRYVAIMGGGGLSEGRGGYVIAIGNEYGSAQGGQIQIVAGNSADSSAGNVGIAFYGAESTGGAAALIGSISGRGGWVLGPTGFNLFQEIRGFSVLRSATTSLGQNAVYVVKNTSAGNTNGDVYMSFHSNNNTGAVNFDIRSNGTGGAFSPASDLRLKEDVQDLEGTLSKLNNLRPVTFRWKQNNEAVNIGFIAQEVQQVFPDLVAERDDGYLSLVGFGKIEAMFVKAIQELKQQLDAANDRIAALEGV